MQKAVFVYELAQLFEENEFIQSVNLQGLLLGKLLLYLVPYIERSKTLEYLNISTNLLGTLDRDFILSGLGVVLPRNLENYREQNDIVFHNSFSFFQRQHLSSQFSMTKQDPELAKTVKTA